MRSSVSRSTPSTPKPPKAYQIGEIVSLKQQIDGTTNARVVVIEWGGDNGRLFGGRQAWFYGVVPDEQTGGEPVYVTADRIADRISK